jgi:hydroxyacylglutathione hydrolase
MTTSLTLKNKLKPIELIPGDGQARYPYCHSLLIEDAGLLIDPSSNRRRLTTLKEQGVIHQVCLTHWHEDHFKDLDLFDDAALWMSAEDAPPLADLAVFWEWYGLARPEGRKLREQLAPALLRDFHYRPRQPDRILTADETVDLGGLTMQVIHTPGHSPGHLSLFFPEIGVLFLGDYLLNSFGPWYGDPYADIDDTLRSIKRLKTIQADLLLTSHGPGIIEQPTAALWDRYLEAVTLREEKLLTFLRQPRTLAEIVEQWIVLGKPGEPREYYWFGEQAHMVKHLDRLIAQGRIWQDQDHFGLQR